MSLFLACELAVLERLDTNEQRARLEQTLAGPLPDIRARTVLRKLYLNITDKLSQELAA